MATGNTRMGRYGLEVEMISGNTANQVKRDWRPASTLQVRRGQRAAPPAPKTPPINLSSGVEAKATAGKAATGASAKAETPEQVAKANAKLTGATE
jgi:hypothetical protein